MEPGDTGQHCEADWVTQPVRMLLLRLSAGTKGCSKGLFIFNSSSMKEHPQTWPQPSVAGYWIGLSPGVCYNIHVWHSLIRPTLKHARLSSRLFHRREKSISVGVCYKYRIQRGLTPRGLWTQGKMYRQTLETQFKYLVCVDIMLPRQCLMVLYPI